MPRGGFREGGGRPKTGRHRAVIYVMPHEEAAIRKLLHKLRDKTKKGDDDTMDNNSEKLIQVVDSLDLWVNGYSGPCVEVTEWLQEEYGLTKDTSDEELEQIAEKISNEMETTDFGQVEIIVNFDILAELKNHRDELQSM